MRFVSVMISLLLVGSAIFSIYHIVVLFSNISDPKIIGGGGESVIFECKENVTQNSPCFGLVMVTRHEWLAQPSLKRIDKLDLPARSIIVTDTKTEECEKKANCNYLIRTLQDDHILYNDDIAYNFLISSQGDIYEGRGWLLQSAEDFENLMKTSYWIGLIGNFTKNPISQMQIDAVQHFILHAKSIGKLISSPNVLCSQDILISNNYTADGLSNSTTKYKQCQNKN